MRAFNETPSNYGGASSAAIQHHYDVNDDFYRLWLDPSMTYSCAMWEGANDDLESSQRRKLSFLAAGARTGGAQTVLDIGSGWGSMLRYLLEVQNVSQVVGLTLSNTQHAHIRSMGDQRCDARLEGWADHNGGPYDAIVSIGAFEHFAAPGMSSKDRMLVYKNFFSMCRNWLQDGGRLALQSIVTTASRLPDAQTIEETRFIFKHIFPESIPPRLSDLVLASERYFEVVSLRNDPDDYARTCRTWHSRLLARRSEAEKIVGQQKVADFLYYLSASARQFEDRRLGLARVIFERQ